MCTAVSRYPLWTMTTTTSRRHPQQEANGTLRGRCGPWLYVPFSGTLPYSHPASGTDHRSLRRLRAWSRSQGPSKSRADHARVLVYCLSFCFVVRLLFVGVLVVGSGGVGGCVVGSPRGEYERTELSRGDGELIVRAAAVLKSKIAVNQTHPHPRRASSKRPPRPKPMAPPRCSGSRVKCPRIRKFACSRAPPKTAE